MQLTPLMACASLDPADAVVVAKALLAHGATVEPKQQEGKTALTEARSNNQTELIELLKAHQPK